MECIQAIINYFLTWILLVIPRDIYFDMYEIVPCFFLTLGIRSDCLICPHISKYGISILLEYDMDLLVVFLLH